MTKEEIEQLNEIEPYRLVTNREEQLYRVRLQEGFSIADENPKSPWINYEEEKPPFGVEVIAYHHKWVDEDFNPNGTRVGFLGCDGFISAFWWDYQDCYETISKSHCESNKDFYRSHIDNTEPEFWLPIPKFSEPPKIVEE